VGLAVNAQHATRLGLQSTPKLHQSIYMPPRHPPSLPRRRLGGEGGSTWQGPSLLLSRVYVGDRCCRKRGLQRRGARHPLITNQGRRSRGNQRCAFGGLRPQFLNGKRSVPSNEMPSRQRAGVSYLPAEIWRDGATLSTCSSVRKKRRCVDETSCTSLPEMSSVLDQVSMHANSLQPARQSHTPPG
jgi:hypothetical protein